MLSYCGLVDGVSASDKDLPVTHNMSYSCIVSMAKMKSISKITTFGLKMIRKVVYKKHFEIPPCEKKVVCNTEFVIWVRNLPFYEELILCVLNYIAHGLTRFS